MSSTTSRRVSIVNTSQRNRTAFGLSGCHRVQADSYRGLGHGALVSRILVAAQAPRYNYLKILLLATLSLLFLRWRPASGGMQDTQDTH